MVRGHADASHELLALIALCASRLELVPVAAAHSALTKAYPLPDARCGAYGTDPDIEACERDSRRGDGATSNRGIAGVVGAWLLQQV